MHKTERLYPQTLQGASACERRRCVQRRASRDGQRMSLVPTKPGHHDVNLVLRKHRTSLIKRLLHLSVQARLKENGCRPTARGKLFVVVPLQHIDGYLYSSFRSCVTRTLRSAKLPCKTLWAIHRKRRLIAAFSLQDCAVAVCREPRTTMSLEISKFSAATIL